jgi:hypothetical protein
MAQLPVDDADKFCQWLLEEFSQERSLQDKKLELWDLIINLVKKMIYMKNQFKELF